MSNTDNSKREELTNYELSSKVVTTVSGGYTVDRLSIAVLVNKARCSEPPKAESRARPGSPRSRRWWPPPPGCARDRGDTIKVLAGEFADAGHDLDPVPAPSIIDVLLRQSGTAINALTVLVVAVLLIVFGIRPLTRVLTPAEPEGGDACRRRRSCRPSRRPR